MSIRHYNPGRNRRGRISLAAERFLYGSLFLSMLSQIIFLFKNESNLIIVSALFASVFALAHAQLAYGKRYFWSYLIFTTCFAVLIEYVSINTAWPFGQISYSNLGPEISKVPVLILVIWLANAHPFLILARRISPNWVLLTGSLALTAYQLFFDQLLVANNFKKWDFIGAHIPFQTHIPMTNLIGWLFVGVVFFGLAHLILPKERRKITASLTSIDISLLWILLYNFTANLFFFGRAGTALIGSLMFGALLAPYLTARYLGQP